MQEFLTQFGIDWKLFISQLINFAILLLVLRFFVYKPVVEILRARRKVIESGLQKAQEAETRLKEVDEVFKKKIKEAENKCVLLLASAETEKKRCEVDLGAQLKKKEEDSLKKAELLVEGRKKEMFREINKEAADLIRSAIARAVDAEPKQIDEMLINKAVSFFKEKNEARS